MNKAYVDGRLEQTVDFDYDEIDRRAGVQEASVIQSATQTELVAAARLLHHIVIIGGTSPKETMLWINVFLFIMGIHPNQKDSGLKISAGLKLSKDEWFRRVSRMRRILKARGLFLPRIAGEWSQAGKMSIANSAVRSWQKRGGQPMIKILEADKKLNWIADHFEKINVSEMTPLARQELKAKLLPVLSIYKNL